MSYNQGTSNSQFRHGNASRSGRSPEYRAWKAMLTRCRNKKQKTWRLYGGRGISVCQSWLESFAAFLADMGPKPSPDHSLDRIDSNGNYEPTNCRWATKTEQARNSRHARRFTFNGETLCISEWAERFHLSYECLKQRLCTLGWTIEKSLTTPNGRR